MARPQKVQQKRRLACPIWEKVQEYYNEWSIPPKNMLLLKREWIMKETVAIYVKARGSKPTKTKNKSSS